MSKTELRLRSSSSRNGSKTAEVSPRIGWPQDCRAKAYQALLNQTVPCDRKSVWTSHCGDDPQWVPVFDKAGIALQILSQQRIGWLADESRAARYLQSHFSNQTLVGAGLFDPDGEFRFARHRILLPFIAGRQIGFIAGVDPELGFADVLAATPSWPIPYRVPAIEPDPVPRRLYLTTELSAALRLGSLGYPAWAVQNPGQLQGGWLRRIESRDVLFCLDADRMSSSGVEPFQDRLTPLCRSFRYKSLQQVETEWIAIQSREERAQSLAMAARYPQPRREWVNRVVKAFQRRKGGLRGLFSL